MSETSNTYFAQIDKNNIVINIVRGNPEGRFEESIKWYPCSHTTNIGDVYNKAEKVYTEQTLSLEQEKQLTLDVVKNIYRNHMSYLTRDYDEYEISTWPTQIEEARYLLSGGKVEDLDFLPGVARKRHMDITILAKRVLYAAKLYKRMTGLLTGDRQMFEDQILGALDIESLIQIRKRIQKWQEEGSA